MEYLHTTRRNESDTSAKHTYFDAIYTYKCKVRSMYGSVGPFFPELKWEKWDDIMNYIQNESDKNNLPYPSHAYLWDCVDSCETYFNKTSSLKYLKSLSQKEREKLLKENGEMTNVIPDTLLPFNNNPITPADFDRKVSPLNFEATYYQFTVTSFGWFNIDVLLNEVDGVKESQLFARITGEYMERVNVFLIIPSHKVYGEGGPADGNEDKYAFFYKDGKIPLPQNVKAYILAVSEQNDKIAFGLQEFKTGLKQEITLSLQTASRTQFELALKSFDTDRLHIKVDETKNASAVRAKDKNIKTLDSQLKEAESLKPKGCDCDCGGQAFPASSDSTSVREK